MREFLGGNKFRGIKFQIDGKGIDEGLENKNKTAKKSMF